MKYYLSALLLFLCSLGNHQVSWAHQSTDSALIFEGVLEKATVVDPQARILYTEYNFKATEPALVAQKNPVMTVSQIGGENPDGSWMITGESLKLTEGNAYIVCLRPGYQMKALPFLRVFQVDGNIVADEQGCPLVAISEEGDLTFSSDCTYPALTYEGTIQNPDPVGREMGPPIGQTPGAVAFSERVTKKRDLMTKDKRLKQTLIAFLSRKGGSSR